MVPIRKKVLLAQNVRTRKEYSGLILDNVKGVLDTETGRVLAIGGDVSMVQVGDNVIVDWRKSTIVTVDGEQRVIISEDDIIAVLEQDSE